MIFSRILGLLIALIIFTPLKASSFEEQIKEFVVGSGVPEESLALLVTDLSDGSTQCAFNETKPLIPASILKTVTIASLLEKVGPDWRYHTKVYTTGKIHEGVLKGNIIVEGSGDPSVNCSCEPQTSDFVAEIVSALQKKRINSIEGSVIVDCSIFPGPATPPSWASGDLPHAYGTGCHGFNFRNNASGKSSVKNPSSVFETALRNALANADISIGSTAVSEENHKNMLLNHESAPIDEIMRSCMMRSDNLFAEALLRTFAHVNGKPATPNEGAALELSYWKKKKVSESGVTIVDGSGLSRSNRMTAIFLAEMLKKMSDDVIYASFLPLAGQEGTLKKFLAGTRLDSYLALKTGSMSGIQCYAGYKLDDDYAPTHVVVVMANNMKDRARLRSALQTLLLSIF